MPSIRNIVFGAAILTTLVPLGLAWGEKPIPAKRVPWTTSRLTGSPDPPPPYRIEQVFARLRFVSAHQRHS